MKKYQPLLQRFVDNRIWRKDFGNTHINIVQFKEQNSLFLYAFTLKTVTEVPFDPENDSLKYLCNLTATALDHIWTGQIT
jgi:hypothetical protein